MGVMNDNSTEVMATIIAAAVVGIVWFIVHMGIGTVSCSSRWSDSGLEYSFGVFSGCRVEVRKGVWIPEDRVREIDINKDAGNDNSKKS